MEESEYIISRLAPFIFGFIQLIIIVACVILVVKKSNLATIIMLISSILSGIFQIVRPIVYKLEIDNFMLVNNIFTIISAIFYGLFGLGLLLLALNENKKKL